VYGENEVCGTCVLILSSVPFDQLRYPAPDKLPTVALASETGWAIKGIPYAMVCMLAGMASVYTSRRNKIELEKSGAQKESEGKHNE
jgi:hypothetical protein